MQRERDRRASSKELWRCSCYRELSQGYSYRVELDEPEWNVMLLDSIASVRAVACLTAA